SSAVMALSTSCTEIEDGYEDIDSWETPDVKPKVYTLNHPCLMHSQEDIDYVKAHLGQSPWNEAYQKLASNSYAQPTYKATPKEYIARLDATNWADGGGRWTQYGVLDKWYPGVQNSYSYLMRDAAAAYQLALRYVLTDDADCAVAARDILIDWATVNKGMIYGTAGTLKDQLIDSNEFLILFQIYQVANAAELLRDFNGWGNTDDYRKVVDWLKTYYYPEASGFLKYKSGDHYWLNWDLACMTACISIGVLDDNQDMINEATMHYMTERGIGAGKHLNAIPYLHEDPDHPGFILGQCNESGRDQGHATLCATLLGIFCQMANNIGEDLFAYADYRACAMAEYVAKYNATTGGNGTSFMFPQNKLPYTNYNFQGYDMPAISEAYRGSVRPGWDIWVGYANAHGRQCYYTEALMNEVRPDGGGGHYGSSSGGFDQTGFSTLMFYRPAQY
ncbi:MAG: alginate lyase family protein, partial [Muribaculaceae bacterium]|nr:alginate lyase family protein [Muribaculaceae bacterium]